MKVFNLVIVFLFLGFSISFAEEFRLKNGEVITGEKIGEEEGFIVLKTQYGNLQVDKKEIQEKPQMRIKVEELVASIRPDTKELIPSKNIVGMHRWLLNQMNQNTGLVESYRPTVDLMLNNQAATYDQALAGLVFLVLDDAKNAKKILEFYENKWDGKGFCNFYFTLDGESGIESTRHLGPNMWIALLALHYERITGQRDYRQLVCDMVSWAMTLPHYKGGAAMSDKDEWRAPWSKVVSTENNIDYYSVLNILEARIDDKVLKEKIKIEKDGVKVFLLKTAYDKTTGGVNRGYHSGVIDREQALDTITWLVASMGIENLRKDGINIGKLIACAERKFRVNDKGISGFDFTDKRGAIRADRPRMISIEWSLGMINLYCIYRNYIVSLGHEQERIGNAKKAKEIFKRADIYEHKISYYIKQIDKTMMVSETQEGMISYPYATEAYKMVFYDSLWWKTPKDGPDGMPAGSAASTAWRVFVGRFNPLIGDGRI